MYYGLTMDTPTKGIDDYVQFIFKKFKKKPVPTEYVFPEGMQWWPIPFFRGYEINRHGIVRSMKNFNKYPYGTIIRYDDKYNYVLSTSNNDRVEINMKELIRLVSESLMYQSRVSAVSDIGGRNQRLFLQTKDPTLDTIQCRVLKRHTPTNKKEDTFFPTFTVLKDDVKYPLFFTEGR